MNRTQRRPQFTFANLLLAACVAVIGASSADAQGLRRRPRTTSSKTPDTTVSLVLITGSNTAAFRARSWRTTLERLKVPFRIRGATGADKIEIRERKRGPLRQVTVIGKVDRSGRLIFADRTFTRSQSAKFGEWLRELKTYGKQGQPRGKPLWGLSKGQFGVLFSDLSGTVATDVSGKELTNAVALLGLPSKYTVRYSVAARKVLSKAPVRQRVKGQSLGTAFALVLHDYGLGFRPLRSPAGDIELVVDPLADAKDAWPVGWKLKTARFKAAPKLFKIGPVSLDKVKLADVFATVTSKTGVPIHIDHRAMAARGIDVGKLVVSYSPRNASYSLLLRDLTTRKKLSYILRIDEAGHPFAWITTWKPGSREE